MPPAVDHPIGSSFGKPSGGCVLHSLMGVSPPVLTRRPFVRKYHCPLYMSSHCREQLDIWQQGFSLYTFDETETPFPCCLGVPLPVLGIQGMYPMVCYSVFNVLTPFRGREVFCLSLPKGGFSDLLQRFLKKISDFFRSPVKKGKKNDTAFGSVIKMNESLNIEFYFYCFFIGFDV